MKKSQFIPDIFKKEMILRESFKTIDEAVLFMVEWFNKLAEHFQRIYKATEEEHYKKDLILTTRIRLLCDKLETYGYKISSEELEQESKKIVDREWPQIKEEVAKILEEREKTFEDLQKFLNDGETESDKK